MLRTCPTPEQLRRLLADRLGDAQERSIGDHVEDCPFCQEMLERLTNEAVGPGRTPSWRATSRGEVDVDADFLAALKSDPPLEAFFGREPAYSSLSPPGRAAEEGLCDRLAPDGYDLLAELGRGGMGIVYKARQRRLNRLVALKMLLAGADASPTQLDRFRLEAETIARLQHPHIVQIYEIGEHGGRPYLTLELVEGESLSQNLGGVPQPARRSAELVETLARAIHAAHRVGIVHRDLKPANVLLTESGAPKITDFGLAKRLDDGVACTTLTEQFLGTPSYMAPEQAVRRPPRRGGGDEGGTTAGVDVYSLGAILYEMLTGQPPFRGESPLETVLQVLHEEPVRPSRLRPEIPRDLESICLKCLEKDPRRRYASAEELAEELHRFLNFEPVAARPVAAPGRVWRWCRRKTSLAIAVGLAALAIVATIVLSISLAVYHYRAASRLGEAIREARAQRRQVDEQASNLAYEHGQALCEQGDVGQGMLWLVRGLKSASLARDADLERAFRLSLSAWRPRLHPLRNRCEHPGPIHAAAYSGDGRLIALSGEDNTAQLRDARTGTPVGPPILHEGRVGALAFSPDGKTLLTGCDDCVARLWDVETGLPAGPELRHDRAVLAVAFSPDGHTVLTGGSDKVARLWDVRDGRPIGRPMVHDDLILSVAFSPDGRAALTGSWDRTARLWDAATGDPIGRPMTHSDRISSLAFSPDGRTILTGCNDRTARLWDRESGLLKGPPLWHQHCVRAVAFGPDGRTILTGGYDGIARLWDAESGSHIGPPLRHQHTVAVVAFSPDDRNILTAGWDHSALIYDVARPSGLSFRHDGFIRAVLFSPDGQTILTASEDRTARLWNARTGEPLGKPLEHEAAVEAVAFSPDGRTVLSGSIDNTARLWDVATSGPIGPALRHDDQVRAVAFSPRGDTVLTGSLDKTARLWDASTGEPLGPPLEHEGPVGALAFSPDGRFFVTGSDDKTARLWDASGGRPVAVGVPLPHAGRVMAVAFSPDGRTVLTGSDDMKARLWDVPSGRLRVAPLEHDGPVSVAAFSPDGRTVITGGWDRVARLWDAATGTSITRPLRHDGSLRALAVSRDGRTILTGSYDRTAQLWDKATGKPIGPAFHHENQVWFVTFSPDGRTVLSGGQESSAHLWNVPTLIDTPIPQVERSIQLSTGMELLDDGSLHILDDSEWNALRARAGAEVSIAKAVGPWKSLSHAPAGDSDRTQLPTEK